MRTLILNAIFFLLMFAPALLIFTLPQPIHRRTGLTYTLASRAYKRLKNTPTPSTAPTVTPLDLEAGTLHDDEEIVLELEAAHPHP
ncbi:hypothetical protein C8F04DRAFT_1279598 [Mycena alexandri]|uniref:Uncharacterized protein n=1 Tax=Mycena alexandri TaxID=1745969 RepID=A0AAD6WN32_9AGAR|nr:hypothetical protein C8F04DRAFT_1279598 [Mycena alexandri]